MAIETTPAEFEDVIRRLTTPINGQYPRPWMTDLTEPGSADVFVVGRNQAKTFREEHVGSHDWFLDALFNRNGLTCRGLYDAVTHGEPSPTRRNLDRFVDLLAAKGANRVLQTNVVCYSTPMSADLSQSRHTGGFERGTVIFETLFDTIRPAAIVAHGAGTVEDLSRVMRAGLPALPAELQPPVAMRLARSGWDTTVFLTNSLAPPAYNRWMSWAWDYLESVAGLVATRVGSRA